MDSAGCGPENPLYEIKAGTMPDTGRYFKSVFFRCPPGHVHEDEKVLTAYTLLVTKEEWLNYGPSKQELIDDLVEQLLQEPELPFPERPAVVTVDGDSRQVDVSSINETKRELLLLVCEFYERRGLLNNLHMDEKRLSFDVAPDVRQAAIAARAMKKSGTKDVN